MCSKVRAVLLSLLLVGLVSGVVFASGDGHHADSGVLLTDFLYRVLNFGIVVALLGYFLIKPIKKGLGGRRDDIENALAEAKRVKEAAEAKFAEYDRKLIQAKEEIAEISDAIRREGELEKQKIIENAKAMALKIEQDVENTAELEVAKVRMQLQREAVQLAVGVAEELLHKNFTKDDDVRLIDEYMQKVGELH
jgi:F-type H+-transporting ATPase subunit b